MSLPSERDLVSLEQAVPAHRMSLEPSDLTIFVLLQLFILPLNRHAEEAVQDFEDAVGIPHVHHDFPAHDPIDNDPMQHLPAPPPPPSEPQPQPVPIPAQPPRPPLDDKKYDNDQPKTKTKVVSGSGRFEKRKDGFMVVPEDELAKGKHPIMVLIEVRSSREAPPRMPLSVRA
jgi:hypothetical protein